MNGGLPPKNASPDGPPQSAPGAASPTTASKTSSQPLSNAEAITRKSGSSFAFAFLAMPRDRRRDIVTFYAFCRLVDDIADDLDIPQPERTRQLASWKRALAGPFPGEPSLAGEVRELIERRQLDRNLFELIIEGCASDIAGNRPAVLPRAGQDALSSPALAPCGLAPVDDAPPIGPRFETYEDLLGYCYKVASAVGLVGIGLFGCREPGSRRYAIALGYALQLTNILRDVAKDFANGGRVYLPAADMARFGVTPEDLEKRKGGPGFPALIAFEASRAEALYTEAVAARPARDRRALVPAEMMRLIYHRILGKMRRGGFRVFDKTYRVGKPGKLLIALRVIVSNAFR